MDFKKPEKFELFLYKIRTRIFLNNFYKNYVKNMNLNGNENIFEFGCGIGAISLHLAYAIKKGKLYCLDTSAAMINETKKNLKKYSNVIYINSDIKDADLQNNFFDVIVVHFVLHDIKKEQRNKVVEKFYSILKNSGRLFIREPIKENHGIKEEEIMELMIGAGFEKEKMEYQEHFMRPKMIAGVFVKE
jgi:ubiquinone/menaquinone biosynthesis C-methylase UbiE